MSSEQPDRQVFLGMPGYGLVSAMAAAGFWNSSRWPESVIKKYTEGSLLCQNFNTLWCTALNHQHAGRRIDYFAMQHADVEPQRNWLDTMIDELEKHNLDILGAVVPIKDTRGLTSIALHKEGDNWNPLCRLSVREAQQLPSTFTSEDVGHPILLNTGLWVCRFDAEWRKQVHFSTNDRIVFDQRTGSYRAQVESEDWFFSRLLHELGLRIGATSKIALMHRGDMLFSNEQTWGAEFDTTAVKESQIKPQPNRFRFPHDVDGWLSRTEGEELAELARGKRVLEIGSYYGRSTICMAQTAQYVVSVDTHDGRGTAVPQNTFQKFYENLERYSVEHKVQAHVCTAREFSDMPRFGLDDFDLIFIDGAHDYESVASDILDATSLLAPGGLIAFHDYHSPADPDVTKAVDELLSAGAELLSTHDSLAVVRPPAAIPLEV